LWISYLLLLLFVVVLFDFNSTWYSAEYGADTIVIDTAAGGTGTAPAGEVL
jgi:glutamate synthase domain-containing protein 2